MFYGVDSNLVVTDKRDSKLEFISLGARTLTLPKIEEPMLGEKIVFSETLDILDENYKVIEKGADVEKFSYVCEFLSFIESWEGYESVNAVFLDKKFDICFILDSRYLVKIGKCDSLQTKFQVLEAIINDGSTDYGQYVSVDLRVPAKASARVDDQLDFSQYVVDTTKP